MSREAGSQRSLHLRALTVAVLAGTLYALSPLSAVLAAALVAMTAWASAGTGPRESRWLIALLLAGLIVRAVAIWTVALGADPQAESFATFFGDGQYALQRSLWLRNLVVGNPVAPFDYMETFGEYGRSGYYLPLAWLQVLFGPAPYALHMVSAMFYLVGAIGLFREARASFGEVAAWIGLALILCLPTLLVWSIAPLKESLYFSLLALALVSVVRAFRSRRWPYRIAAALLAVAALGAIATLRSGGLVIAIGGVAFGLALACAFQHRRLALIAAVVLPAAAGAALTRPSVNEPLKTTLGQAVAVHIGHVRTEGASYKLLEFDFYEDRGRKPASLTPPETLRYLAAAIREFLLLPKPWAPATPSDIVMIPQQLVWYLLLICVGPGVVAGLRRDALLTGLLFGCVLVGIVVIAPASGNVGTLVRHRDMIVPILVWIGALGAVVTIRWCAGHIRKEG